MNTHLLQCHLEPWLWTYYFSEDRISNRFSVQEYPNREGSSFREVKAMLESKHEGNMKAKLETRRKTVGKQKHFVEKKTDGRVC